MTGAPADTDGTGDHPARALAEALHIPGARRVALVAEGASVPTWSSTPAGSDEVIEGTAAIAVVLMRAARELLRLTSGDDVDDVLLTSGNYFHVLRLVERAGHGAEVVHLTLLRSGANLAMARHELRRAAAVYRDGPHALGTSPVPSGISVAAVPPLVTPSAPAGEQVAAHFSPAHAAAEPATRTTGGSELDAPTVDSGAAAPFAMPERGISLEPPEAPPAHVSPDVEATADTTLIPGALTTFEPLSAAGPAEGPLPFQGYGPPRRPGAFLAAQADEDAATRFPAEVAGAHHVPPGGVSVDLPDLSWAGETRPTSETGDGPAGATLDAGDVPSLFSLLNQPFTDDSPTLDRIMVALRDL